MVNDIVKFYFVEKVAFPAQNRHFIRSIPMNLTELIAYTAMT